MLELDGITVGHAGRLVLSVDQLVFDTGKRYGIIGENGSGKTTLLKVISQWLKPTSGEVKGLKGLEIGYMPQKPYIFSISAFDNVLIALEGLQDREERAKKALEKVGLTGYTKQRADRLSGGEMQRLALARLIAKPRDVLLLDEPTSATDIRGTDQIESVLKEYCQKTSCTLIMTTHSPAQALRMVEAVVFIEEGRVIEQGKADTVIHHATHPLTQSFLEHWHI
ncbi:MAG: ABC transporter ATP-binding protein [Anaerolineaceae bacterium]